MESLSIEMLSRICLYLPLEGVQIFSMTCQSINKFLSSEYFLKKYITDLGNEQLKKVNLNFLEKHGSKLSSRQIACLRPEQKPEKMIKAGFFDEDKKQQFLIRLIYSIRKTEIMYTLEEKSPYMPIMCCGGFSKLKFTNHVIKEYIFLNTVYGKKSWKLLLEKRGSDKKLLQEISEDKSIKSNLYNLICKNNLRLQVEESSQELTDFYTQLWTEYAPKNLDPLNKVFYYIPIEIFKGFCGFIKKNDTDFGSFSRWYLSEEHLIEWNLAFKNRKIEKVDVCLLPDIKKETFLNFINIIKNQELKPYVKVEYVIENKMENLNVSWLQTFIKFAKTSKNIKGWKIFQIPK